MSRGILVMKGRQCGLTTILRQQREAAGLDPMFAAPEESARYWDFVKAMQVAARNVPVVTSKSDQRFSHYDQRSSELQGKTE